MGELSATDERKYRSLQRATERELLQARPQTFCLEWLIIQWHSEALRDIACRCDDKYVLL